MTNTLNKKIMATGPSQNRDNPIRACMDENETLVQRARSRPPRNILQRLFPDGSHRLTSEAELEELEAGFDYRRRALRLAVESKLQAVEEACNHVLVTGKSEIRRERQEFFADQVTRLSSAMHNYAEVFNTEIDQRLSQLRQRYQNEVIQKKEEERLYRQIDDFHEVIEEMAREFQQIINEGVHADSPVLNRASR